MMAASDHLGRISVALLAAALAASILVLVVEAEPAGAAFPGTGGAIAFESDRTGNSEIFVMNADGTRETNITRSADQEHEPAYSPDGKKIAYSEGFLFRDVWRMRSDGSNPVQLTANGMVVDDTPSWQPLP